MNEFEDTLLDINRDNLNSIAKKHNDIDTKAIGIITISGFLISFLLGSVTSESCISSILFVLTSLSFLLTVFFSILILKPREAHEPSTLNLITDLKDEDEDVQISRILQTHAEIENELQDVCTGKASELDKAIVGLGFSVILLIIYTIFTFLTSF